MSLSSRALAFEKPLTGLLPPVVEKRKSPPAESWKAFKKRENLRRQRHSMSGAALSCARLE